MRGVDVEEAAAVGADGLDDDLRGDRPLGDGLLGALQGRGIDIAAQILRHALPDEDQADDDRERQQDVERAAGQIDPEIADGLRRPADEAADEGDGDGDAGRGRDEVMDREPGHLDEIAERRLAAVVLPVGVGREADGRVQRQVLLHAGHALGIEGQEVLQPQHRVERGEAGEIEQQHGDGIGQPMLLLLGIDARDPIDDALDGPQHGAEEGRARRRRRAPYSLPSGTAMAATIAQKIAICRSPFAVMVVP